MFTLNKLSGITVGARVAERSSSERPRAPTRHAAGSYPIAADTVDTAIPGGPHPSCGRTSDGLLLLSLPTEGRCGVSWAMGLGLWRPAWQAVVWPVGLCVHHALTGVAVRKSCNERLQRDCVWTWANAGVGLPGQAPGLLLSHSYFPEMSRPLRWSECDLSI